jgi:hypothetical protein
MFYYTNFIQETNAWWLRRVRPLWLGSIALWAYWLFHRYYFFGKHAVQSQRKASEQENSRRAALNKGDFGFQFQYKPTLERSRKRQIMELLGDNYDHSIAFEDRLIDIATFEQLQATIDEENDY